MKSIRSFFISYSRAALGDDPEPVAEFYADSFIAAGPKGSLSFNNDSKFIKWLTELISFNKQSGMESMKPLKVFSMGIGEFYTKSTVQWAATFKKTGDEQITFEVTYILYHPKDSPKIVMYISHEDQEELMKSKKLM